jgi:ribose transport system permease protein
MQLNAVHADHEEQVSVFRRALERARKVLAYREMSVAIIIVGFFVLLTISTPHFLTSQNLNSVAVSLSLDAIMSVGMTVVLVSGGFDLSIGSIFGLASVLLVTLRINGVPFGPALILTFAAALAVGFVNGFLVAKVKVNALIATLGMMGVTRGFTYVVSQGQSKNTSFPEWFLFPGWGKIAGLPVIPIIMVIIVALGQFLVGRTASLKKLYFIGSNEVAARFTGIRVDRVRWLAYIACALFAGFAATLNISRFKFSAPNNGQGAELRVIAACIIGGLTLAGGEGSVIGAVLGVILLALVNNAMVLLNASFYWQQVISGSILILAVVFDLVRNRKRL